MIDVSQITEVAGRAVKHSLAAYEQALKDPNTGTDPMYSRLGGEDDGGETRDTLKLMREPSDEVLLAGIAPMQWRKALDLMLKKADVLDAAIWATKVERNLTLWPEQRARLESIGLRVEQKKGEDALFKVWTYGGAYVDIDIAAQAAAGYGSLEGFIRHEAEAWRRRQETIAETVRLTTIRATHDWDAHVRAWVPKGDGPVLRYSRHKGYYPHPDQAMALAARTKA